MTDYTSSRWKKFRRDILELDGEKCQVCGRTGAEVVLQIHHKRYYPGREPWDYPTQDCVVLCKGCHAAEHGIIPPKFGWQYVAHEDLGDLVGRCQLCGNSFRHQFVVFHENWGTMEVGQNCCDHLTCTEIAKNKLESIHRYENRKKCFINSKRWKSIREGAFRIERSGFRIEIRLGNGGYRIYVEGHRGKCKFSSISDAKAKVFEILEDGSLRDYLKKKR